MAIVAFTSARSTLRGAINHYKEKEKSLRGEKGRGKGRKRLVLKFLAGEDLGPEQVSDVATHIFFGMEIIAAIITLYAIWARRHRLATDFFDYSFASWTFPFALTINACFSYSFSLGFEGRRPNPIFIPVVAFLATGSIIVATIVLGINFYYLKTLFKSMFLQSSNPNYFEDGKKELKTVTAPEPGGTRGNLEMQNSRPAET